MRLCGRSTWLGVGFINGMSRIAVRPYSRVAVAWVGGRYNSNFAVCELSTLPLLVKVQE
jgi:hypothetical protein